MRFTLHQSTYGEILETIYRTLLSEKLRESKRTFYKQWEFKNTCAYIAVKTGLATCYKSVNNNYYTSKQYEGDETYQTKFEIDMPKRKIFVQ
jgi:hypothetical protein